MKKLLLALAAVALSTSFAFATDSSHPSFPSFNFTNTANVTQLNKGITDSYVNNSLFNVQAAAVVGKTKWTNVTASNSLTLNQTNQDIRNSDATNTTVNIQAAGVLSHFHY